MPKAKAKSKPTETQPKATRKSPRNAAQTSELDLILDSKTMEATEEVKRLIREAVFRLFAEIEKYMLTLDNKVAEHLKTIVANATEAVERFGFIIQEAEMANAEPLWHLLLGGEEAVDERKIVLGMINKLNETDLTLEDLDAAAILVRMANGDNNVKGHMQEELDAAHTMIELSRGDAGVVDGNPASSSSGGSDDADAPGPPRDSHDDRDNADDTDGANEKNGSEDADNADDEDGNNISTSNVRAEPCILPNGTKLKLIPLDPKFEPQDIPADTDAGLSYIKIRDNEIAKQTRSRGHKQSEKQVKALAKPDGPKPYDNFVEKRKSRPDAFEDDEYPFHKFLPYDTGSALGGSMSMGPEDVRRKMEEEGRMPSGKKNNSKSAKRQKVS